MTIDNNINKVTVSSYLCMVLLCKCVLSKLHPRCNRSCTMVSPQLPWLPGFHECDCVESDSHQSRAFPMVTRSPLHIMAAMVTVKHVHTPVALVKTSHGFGKAGILSDVTVFRLVSVE